MTPDMIFSNLSVILASALGAGIGSFFSFRIAAYQIASNKQIEVEKEIKPLLFMLKQQFERFKSIHDQINKEMEERFKDKNDDWEASCINI